MRIGVIGSGIAGLVASRKLCDAGHRVLMIERQSSIGMDAHSVDITSPELPNAVRADVPSRMYNPLEWPRLHQLYCDLNVQSEPVCATQSFSEVGGKTYLTLDQANRPATVAASLLNRKSRQILKQAKKLQRQGGFDLQKGISPSTTLLDYLQPEYSDEFIYEFLYPTLSSTVFTCSFASLDHYPAKTVLAILQNLTADSTLLRIRLGTQDVIKRLLVDAIDLRLNCEVSQVVVKNDHVLVTMVDGGTDSFDHLVVATQANTAVDLVAQLSPIEKEALSSFRYEAIPVFVHTDRSLMPRNERDWATFNMFVSGDRQAAMCTVWLNRFHQDWTIDHPVFQTINAFSTPDSSTVIGQCVMQRPVVNLNSMAAWQTIAEMNRQPGRRIWFCGSYAGQGTPLLESGVVSANSVVDAIQGSLAKAT